jgi:hypothetical protein
MRVYRNVADLTLPVRAGYFIESSRLTPLVVASERVLAVVQEIERAQCQAWHERVRGFYTRPVAVEFADELETLRRACKRGSVDDRVVRDFLVEAKAIQALLADLEQHPGESSQSTLKIDRVRQPLADIRRAIDQTEQYSQLLDQGSQ